MMPLRVRCARHWSCEASVVRENEQIAGGQAFGVHREVSARDFKLKHGDPLLGADGHGHRCGRV